VDYNYNVAVVTEIDNMTEYMNKIRAKILTFWENQPEILIRLPPHCFEITPALFLSKDYSPYTMGKKMMPSWVDPMVVAMMNEARKIYQTEEQTMKQREKYFKYLTNTDGIYEIRVEFESNTYRFFSFFDEGKLIITINGFQKKTKKIPKSEIEKAQRIKKQYLDEK